MRFLDVLNSHTVIHDRSAMQALYTIDEMDEDMRGDGFLSINFAGADDGGDDIHFKADVEIDLNPNDPSKFEVTDARGNPHSFTAYTPVNLAASDCAKKED